MIGHRHDTHFLDRENLASKIKRHLDRPENKQLYEMCKTGDPAQLDLVAKHMLKGFIEPIRRSKGKWEDISLSWPIPQSCFRDLSVHLQAIIQTSYKGPRAGFEIGAVPVDEDLFVLTLKLMRRK